MEAEKDRDTKSCRLNLANKKLSLSKQVICYLRLKRGKLVAKMRLLGFKYGKYSGKYICYEQILSQQQKIKLVVKVKSKFSENQKILHKMIIPFCHINVLFKTCLK